MFQVLSAEARVHPILCPAILSFCLLFVCQAQEQPQSPASAPSAPQAAAQPRPAPPKPASSAIRTDSSDGQFSIALYYWPSVTHPQVRTGHSAVEGTNSDLDYAHKNQGTPGAVLSFPGGGQNTVRLSYFQFRGSGDTTAGNDLVIFGNIYDKGDLISTKYRIQNAKVSYDFLSWPFPAGDHKLRIKTLWEAQATWVRTNLNAPLKPTTDSDGNLIDNTAQGTNWFLAPSIGMGLEYIASKHFRFEIQGSGFEIPHRWYVWGADALGAYRAGKFEIFFGGKGFGFRTSPKRDQFVRAKMAGGFIGIRWYPSF